MSIRRKLKKSKKITIWIEQQMSDEMHAIYMARGIPISEQIRRALVPYLLEQLEDLGSYPGEAGK